MREEGLEQGLEEGIEKGIEKGIVQGKRETLERLLTARFGPLPEQVQGRVDALSSPEELDPYLDRVLTAATLEDIGLSD